MVFEFQTSETLDYLSCAEKGIKELDKKRSQLMVDHR